MMKYFLILLMLFLPACMGTMSMTQDGYKQTHIYDNSFLNTSSKLTVYEKCDAEGANCTVIGKYHSDTTGFIPSVGGQALQGVAIGVGLSEYNNNNSSNSAGGSTVINNTCRGNCGGGK